MNKLSMIALIYKKVGNETARMEIDVLLTIEKSNGLLLLKEIDYIKTYGYFEEGLFLLVNSKTLLAAPLLRKCIPIRLDS